MPQTMCCVPFCSRKGRHKFPKDKQRQAAWVQAIRRVKTKFEIWTPSEYSYVCENHFTEDDYHTITYAGNERRKRALRKTAVPSIFSWTNKATVAKSQERKERRLERENRKRKLFEDVTNMEQSGENTSFEPEYIATKIDIVTSDIDVGASEEVVTQQECVEQIISITDEKVTFMDSFVQTECETEDAAIQTTTTLAFSINKFEDDEAAVHFYTGLENYMKFFFVLNTLGPAAYHLNYVYHSITSISVADQFFITLIKLRRHMTNFELSRLFNVSESVVSNIFITWVLFMEKQWKEINIWPSQTLVHYFAPSSFKRLYPKTRVIIDGTECPIKKPKNPTAQQATFSTYKNRNTVKVLVGSTPGGLISYVSPAYGGATSDRQIVERSSLTRLCSKSDSIMADKGFNVQDIFAPHDVHINIPTFFKKQNRISNETAIKDRKISSKRVHVERIIGLGKTYKILTEPLTSTETKLSSEIIFVCFMLCNFRNGIVSTYA
ncbi:uncharacterized protein LOC127849625 [Dreissena polymorpha]|nr:uncharacterized protein LOC127832129 [Dreissena polymorpha]XP_052238332.1 uncharacterized protein LOC127849625 [Dreissena polymorpha]